MSGLTVEISSPPIFLSDNVGLLLRLVAAHDGLSEHEFVRRAIVGRAQSIGIAGLAGCGDITLNPASESRGGKARHRVPSRCLGPP